MNGRGCYAVRLNWEEINMKSTTAAACLAATVAATVALPAWGQGHMISTTLVVVTARPGGTPVTAAVSSVEVGVDFGPTQGGAPTYQPLKITLATGATQFQAQFNGGPAVSLSHVKVWRNWNTVNTAINVQMDRPSTLNADWKSWMAQAQQRVIAPGSVVVSVLAGGTAARSVNATSCAPRAWSVLPPNAAGTGETERLTLLCNFVMDQMGSPLNPLFLLGPGTVHTAPAPVASLTLTAGGLPLTPNVTTNGGGLTGWVLTDGTEEWDFVVASIQ
jgi:hypothetical protein